MAGKDPYIGQDASVLDDEKDPLVGQDASALDDAPAAAPKPPPISGMGAQNVNTLDSAALGLLPRASALSDAIQKVGGRPEGADLSVDLMHPSTIVKNIGARGAYGIEAGNKFLSHPIDTMKELGETYDAQLPKYQGGMNRANEEHPYRSLLGKALPAVLSAPKTAAQLAVNTGLQTLLGTQRDLGKVATDGTEAAKLAGETALGTALGYLGYKYPIGTGLTMAVTPTVAGDALGMSKSQKQQMTAGGVISALLGGANRWLNTKGENFVGRGEKAAEEALVEPRAAAAKAGERVDKLGESLARANESADTAKQKLEQMPTPEAAQATAKEKLQAILQRRAEKRAAAEIAQVEDFANRTKQGLDSATAEQNKRARLEYQAGEKGVAEQRGSFEDAVKDLGKRRMEAEGEKQKGFLDAFEQNETGRVRDIAQAKAAAKVRAALESAKAEGKSSALAQAVSKLGHDSKDMYAAARLLKGLPDEELGPELRTAIDALLPDFKAQTAATAKEFANGKQAYLDKLTKQYEAAQQAQPAPEPPEMPLSARPTPKKINPQALTEESPAVALGKAQPSIPGERTGIYEMKSLPPAAEPKPEPGSFVGENTRQTLAKGAGYDMSADNPAGAVSRFAEVLKKYGLDPGGNPDPSAEGIFGRKLVPQSSKTETNAGRSQGRVRITPQPVEEETIPFPSADVEQSPAFMRKAEAARVAEMRAKAALENPQAGQAAADKAAFRRMLMERQAGRAQKAAGSVAQRAEMAKKALADAQAQATPEAVRAAGYKQMKDAALREGVLGGPNSVMKGGPIMTALKEAYKRPEARAWLFDALGSRMQSHQGLRQAARVIESKDLAGLLSLAQKDPSIAREIEAAIRSGK